MFCKTNDNLTIYYEVHGNEQAAETIVFLNGLSQSTVSWVLTLPYFKATHKIVLMDFIFKGKSDKTGEWRSFDQHAQDLLCLMDHLNPVSYTHLDVYKRQKYQKAGSNPLNGQYAKGHWHKVVQK